MQIENEDVIVGEADGKFAKSPMMFNSRAIKKGEQLLLHQHHGCKSRWPTAREVRESPAKVAKH